MRRVLLLALLALALPMAAMAGVIFTTGPFVGGTVSRNVSGGFTPGIFNVAVNGSVDHLRLSTTGLGSGCSGTGGTCSFGSGTVTVVSASGPTLFTDTVENGMITRTSTTATIDALLVPNSTTAGLGVSFSVKFGAPPAPPPLNQLMGGVALVGTPEPGTLYLLGTSVIGLAGMARRRFRLGK